MWVCRLFVHVHTGAYPWVVRCKRCCICTWIVITTLHRLSTRTRYGVVRKGSEHRRANANQGRTGGPRVHVRDLQNGQAYRVGDALPPPRHQLCGLLAGPAHQPHFRSHRHHNKLAIGTAGVASFSKHTRYSRADGVSLSSTEKTVFRKGAGGNGDHCHPQTLVRHLQNTTSNTSPCSPLVRERGTESRNQSRLSASCLVRNRGEAAFPELVLVATRLDPLADVGEVC